MHLLSSIQQTVNVFQVIFVCACTREEGVLLEVLDAILTQSVLSAANESANQIFRLLRNICDLLWELESLLFKT